jgi:hypothetical protein
MWRKWRHKFHVLLTLTLTGEQQSKSRSDSFTHGERATSTHWIGGCIDTRAGMDAVAKRNMKRLYRHYSWSERGGEEKYEEAV